MFIFVLLVAAKADLAAGDGDVANRDVCDAALATHHVAAPTVCSAAHHVAAWPFLLGALESTTTSQSTTPSTVSCVQHKDRKRLP